ncbi:hypothetical protein Syun_016745 [Stephania yunnanensis]|uniref:Serine-threonine/tyrosine-protein kinase catalytic domain-containing protein n=1 Tax=Stephania yunnanensis TaxID=152371 RepID=A0AAP0J5S3_9MAGN
MKDKKKFQSLIQYIIEITLYIVARYLASRTKFSSREFLLDLYVYKGSLDQDGTTGAIKVLNLHQRGASKTFKAECEALRNIRHRNLVKIVTSCSSIESKGNDFKALVFEFMQNGSLEKW